MKTQVDIKLLNGSKQEVTYEDVETVGMPLADGSGEQVFTAGEPLDEVPVELDFGEGNQRVDVPEGYVVRSAVIAKPEGAERVIAKGETLAGIPGEYVTPGTTKEVEPYFRDCLVIDNPEDVSALLSDRSNIGKYVKYMGETGEYTAGQHYKVVDEYEAFEPESCPATAVEVTSDTVLTATLEGCKVGDLVVAAFAIRSDLVSLSDGWTLISTSQGESEINSTYALTYEQPLSLAYKYATSATEELTVTQTTAARIYINMVSLSGASGFTDVEYQYQDNSTATDAKSITVLRPDGKLVLWALVRMYWGSAVWEASNEATLIQSTSSTQPRLLLAIDTSEDQSVTFTSSTQQTTDAYICGALSVELEPAAHLVEVDSSEVPTIDNQTVTAEGDERWNEVLVKKPENLVPENIPKGIEIAGVSGALEAITLEAVIARDFPDPLGSDQVVSLPAMIFMNAKITEASFPACTSIGASAFNGCTSLQTITLGCNSNFHHLLSDAAFYRCTNLSELRFMYSGSYVDGAIELNAYYDRASRIFAFCNKLKSIHVVLKSSVTAGFSAVFGSSLFQNCTELSKITVDGLVGAYRLSLGSAYSMYEIDQYAFAGCTNLTTLSLSLVGSVGFFVSSYAFSGCSKLQDLWLNFTAIPNSSSSRSFGLGSSAFAGTPMASSGLTGAFGNIHVTKNAYSYLRVASGWSSLAARMVSY